MLVSRARRRLHGNTSDLAIPLCTRERFRYLETTRLHGFDSLPAFLTETNLRGGVYSIAHNGLPIDFSLRIVPGTPLFVVLHGAADVDVNLPFLSGAGITKDLGCSVLSISDPSLYLHRDLNLSWFAGNHAQPHLLDDLAQLVTHVRSLTDAPRLIFFGGSGGGFASLSLASLVPEATAIVMNPQIAIQRYHKMHVDRYVDLAWDYDLKNFRRTCRSNVEATLGQSIYFPTIYYIQNSRDIFHVKNHLRPFRDRFLNRADTYLLLDAWDDGHTPPPKPMIRKILEAGITSDHSALESLGFQRLYKPIDFEKILDSESTK